MSRVRGVLTVLGLFAVPGVASAQQGGAIAGQVVDGATGKPVSAVIVSIAGPGAAAMERGNPSNPPTRILTSADGRFVFPNLPVPGTFTVTATKGGYAEGASGRRRPGGAVQSLSLSPAAASAETVVRVWKHGAITGTVTDEAGEPVVGLVVRLLPRTRPGVPPAPPPGASPSFVALPRPSAGVQVLTDDRGMYRFGNVPEGDYFVMASPPLLSSMRDIFTNLARTGSGSGAMLDLLSAGDVSSGRSLAQTAAPMQIGDALVSVGQGRAIVLPSTGGHIRVYPPTFYPAALVASQAAAIAISTGEERAGIDITLAPVPAARVTGTMLDRDGPSSMVTLRLVPSGSEGMSPEVVAPGSITDGSGAFVFAGVPAGQYRLRGSAGLRGSVDVPVSVGGDDIDGLTVTAVPSLKVTATLLFDGNTPPPAASGRGPLPMPGFVLDPVNDGNGPNQLDAQAIGIAYVERSYLVSGYPPGRYRVRMMNSPVGWMFKAAMLNGVDVSETPFDLTKDVQDLRLVFTDRWTGISGVVQGQGADAAAVVIFPADASKWSGEGLAPRRFKSARADARGQFGISSLPPGDYYAIAIPDEQSGDWRDPARLDGLARAAVQITIVEGEHRTVTVPIREVRQ